MKEQYNWTPIDTVAEEESHCVRKEKHSVECEQEVNGVVMTVYFPNLIRRNDCTSTYLNKLVSNPSIHPSIIDWSSAEDKAIG